MILTSNTARYHFNYSSRSLAGSSSVVISQNVLLNYTSYVSKLLMLCFLPPICQKNVTKSSFASPQALLWTSLQIRKCGKANLLRPPVAVTRTTHLAEQHANKMHTWSPLIKWQASSLREEACWRPGNEQREREGLEARDYENYNNNNSPVKIRGKSEVQRNLTRRGILYWTEKNLAVKRDYIYKRLNRKDKKITEVKKWDHESNLTRVTGKFVIKKAN